MLVGQQFMVPSPVQFLLVIATQMSNSAKVYHMRHHDFQPDMLKNMLGLLLTLSGTNLVKPQRSVQK